MRKAVNILFLGGAKRVSMARKLKRAGADLGLDVTLFSYELGTHVPVAAEAAVITGLRWNDPRLMENLHEAVMTNRIDIIIPFVDPAVEVAAKYCAADIEAECFTPGRDASLAAVMFDKVQADALFRSLGFPLPLRPEELSGDAKIIAKPRCGSASKGIKVLCRDEYANLADTPEGEGYLFQEYIGRRREYTVDCYVTSRGKFVCAVPRERLEVQGGEVTSTVTVRDHEIESLSRHILSELKFTGPVTIQFMREVLPDGEPGRLMLMEINPRLGGGAVCAVHAGAALPEYILRDWMGEDIAECDSWRDGVMICRYQQEVAFEHGHLID